MNPNRDAKNRLTVPVALRKVVPGNASPTIHDEVRDEIAIPRVEREQESWVKVMEQCPIPIDDVPKRSHEFSKKLIL